LLPQNENVLNRWRVRAAIDAKLYTIPISEGTVNNEKVRYISSWLNQNNSIYLPSYVVMYHSRPGNEVHLDEGLYPITDDGEKIDNFRNGYIRLSNTPEQAKQISDSANMGDTVIYEVLAPITKLLPDTDRINKQRSLGINIGSSLSDSICCGGARIKGNIEAWQIQAYEPHTNAIPPVNEEAASIPADPITWYSPNLKIPYHEGDTVRALFTSAHILQITDESVRYIIPEETGDEPYMMERSRFEENLDNGTYRTITSGDTVLNIDPKAATVIPDPPQITELINSGEYLPERQPVPVP